MTRGVHRPADAPDPFLATLRAWMEVLPGSARFTHLTAAALGGLWLPPLPAVLPVVVTIDAQDSRPVRPGLRVLRTRQPAPSTWCGGLPVDPVPDVLLTLARDLGDLDLAVVVSSALRAGLTDRSTLAATASTSRRGAPRLRRVLADAHGASESPWEVLLERLHLACGVEVRPQFEVRDEHGVFVARGDLWLAGSRTLHEYDGSDHLDVAQQRRDLRRARHLVRIGWIRRGYTSHDLLHRAVGMLRDVDESIGRPHDPTRVQPWHDLLRESCFTPAGRRRLQLRLGVA